MIFGIGTDILAIERIRKVIHDNPRFCDRIFTPAEIKYCCAKANPPQSFAVRFAAKEAFMKALGTGWDGFVNWVDIEVINAEGGKPYIQVYGKTKTILAELGITCIHLSLSHEKENAIAFVVLEYLSS